MSALVVSASLKDNYYSHGEQEHDFEEVTFYPILPYGFKPGFDMTGWVSRVGGSDGNQESESSVISLVRDPQVSGVVVELLARGSVHSERRGETAMISFPDPHAYIGTTLPILNLHIKYLGKYVSFEVEIQDVDEVVHVIRASNSQSVAKRVENQCSVPLKLIQGWNKVHLDLSAICLKVFGCELKQVLRVFVYATCRLRRMYFSDRVYGRDSDLPFCLRVNTSTTGFSDFGDTLVEDHHRHHHQEEEEEEEEGGGGLS